MSYPGKEVAKFAQLRYRDELYALEAFKKEEFEIALKQSFHKIDALLEDTVRNHFLESPKEMTNFLYRKMKAYLNDLRAIRIPQTKTTKNGKQTSSKTGNLVGKSSMHCRHQMLTQTETRRNPT